MKCTISSCLHRSSETEECSLGEPGTVFGRKTPYQGLRRSGSLVLASLELGKVLADRRATIFRAYGTCMYPVILPGDILRIDSRSAKEIAVGDVAVCRRENYLFGHRAIGKGVHNGAPYIITKPDRAVRGNDGPSYDNDVLGIVSTIERNGKRSDPASRSHPSHSRFYNSSRLMLIESSLALRGWLINLLALFQHGAVYKYIIRSLLAAKGSKLSFIVRLHFTAKRDLDLYRAMPAEEFDVSSFAWQGRKIDKWTLALHIDGKLHPAARASFVLRPPECPFAGWWLDDLQVRVRYRGAGFEKQLISKAEEILARGGCRLRTAEESGKTNKSIAISLKRWIPASIKTSIKASPLFLRHRSFFTNIYHCSVYRTGSRWLGRILSDLRVFRYSGLLYEAHFQRIFGTVKRPDKTVTYKRFPHTESFPGHKIVSIYASYENYMLIPKPEEHRTFFILRDPRDIVVSHYFASLRDARTLMNAKHYKMMADSENGILLMIDRLEEMGLFSSLESWASLAGNDTRVLLLHFEELIGSCQFDLFKKLFRHCDIAMPNNLLKKLLYDHSFEVLSGGRKPGEEDSNSHYRKGISGDWKNHFTDKHIEKFKAVTGNLVTITGYEW